MTTRTATRPDHKGPGDPERDTPQGNDVPRPPGDHNVWPASLTERTSDDDPSFKTTPSGRRAKSPSPGIPEPYTGTPVDPTAFDPRAAPIGTPIAFPDPDEPYPQEGDPYPPPTDPPVAYGTLAAKALNDDGTRKDDGDDKAGGVRSGKASGKSDADVASKEKVLGTSPSRQYDT